jgi:hypothetical protein
MQVLLRDNDLKLVLYSIQGYNKSKYFTIFVSVEDMRSRIFLYSLAALTLITGVFAQKSNIPPYYFANYGIKVQREQIQDMFVTIDATKSIGSELDSAFFQDLSQNFDQVFPYLPQDSQFKIIYEQCRITTDALASSYNYNGFSKFLDDCFNPFNRSIKIMNEKYTVQPVVALNPADGAAPLSVTFDATDSIDPSNDTIPSSNYFRYYKDTQGVDQLIGQ